MTTDIHADLKNWLQRAEQIVNLALINNKFSPKRSYRNFEFSPKCPVRLENEILAVDDLQILLINKEKTLELVRQFWNAPEHFLSKQQAITGVYGGDKQQSFRMQHSNDRKLTKLMSRSRRTLRKACESLPYKIDWFCHDRQRKGYYLYRISL